MCVLPLNTDEYIPQTDTEYAKQFYKDSGKLENWKNYKRSNKPFVRTFLLQRQSGICPICGKVMDDESKMVLHHIAYMYTCHHSERILHGEMCSECRNLHPVWFEKCMARMIMVHSGCHFRIHKKKIIDEKNRRKKSNSDAP